MQQAKGSLYLQLNRPWYIDCASIILSIIGSLFLRELCWNNHISNFNGNNRLVCKVSFTVYNMVQEATSWEYFTCNSPIVLLYYIMCKCLH